MIFNRYSNTDENKYKCKGPLKYYLRESNIVLLFHIINVGQGLMSLIIYPDKTTMLFDCFVTDDNKNEILEYLREYIPIRKNEDNQDEQWIDVFVNSHRDIDHYKGLKTINSGFKIKSIWDSGQYGTGASSQNGHYEYYMRLKRKLKNDYGDDAVPILEPSNTPFKIFGKAKVYCLNSKEDFVEGAEDTDNFYCLNTESELEMSIQECFQKSETKMQHTNCIILLVDYNGKRLMLTGDSDWKSWRDSIVPNFKDKDLLKTNFLIASHHGSRSFFTDEKLNEDIDVKKNPETTYIEHIELLAPTVTLISCGEYTTHHHPNEAAVKVYSENTSYNQVYTTNQKNASFIGFIKDDGFSGVTISKFQEEKSNPELDFKLECYYEMDGQKMIVVPGQTLITDKKLIFKACEIRNLADNLIKEDVRVIWEVSNVGKREDEEHQEIYYIGKDEKKVSYTSEMRRDLVYNGTHMVRCTIENKDRKKWITKVFTVKGSK